MARPHNGSGTSRTGATRRRCHMQRVQQHQFVDLAKQRSPAKTASNSSRSPRIPGNCRRPRSFNRNGPGRVRARLRARRAAGALPRPGHRRARQALREVQARQHADPAAAHRHALGRRAGLERRRQVPALERHPQRRAAALARRRRPRQRRSATRPATATATPSTARAGRSPASTATAASSATSTTARSPCWPTSSTASRSTPPTTPSSIPTAASGSPTPATAA